MPSKATQKSPQQITQLVELMRNLDAKQYQNLLDRLHTEHPSLAEALLDAMFTFDDLIYLTDRSMQTLLKELDRPTLTRALKKVNDELMNKIMNNLSKRAGENLLEEMSLLPPTRVSEVMEAQREIAKIARSMEEKGTITIVRPDDDDPLV